MRYRGMLEDVRSLSPISTRVLKETVNENEEF